jgi:hypothetical protein
MRPFMGEIHHILVPVRSRCRSVVTAPAAGSKSVAATDTKVSTDTIVQSIHRHAYDLITPQPDPFSRE